MSAQEDLQVNLPLLMCGLCEKQFSDQDQYYLHFKTHNEIDMKKILHKCSITDKVDQTDYKCSICSKLFASICTLHDHLFSCFCSGSYIFLHHKRTAYPLSKFCSLYENRNKVQEEHKYSCNNSSLDKNVEMTADTPCDVLEKLLQAVEGEGNWAESKNNLCDTGTDIPNIKTVKEKPCRTKCKRKLRNLTTRHLETKLKNEKKRQRVIVKGTNDTKAGAKTLKDNSMEDTNTIHSKGDEGSLLRKETKTNHKKERLIKDKVNGTAAKHKKLDSENNQGLGMKDLMKRRGRPKKTQVGSRDQVLRKRGCPIKRELQLQSEIEPEKTSNLVRDVENDKMQEIIQADSSKQCSMSLEASLDVKKEKETIDKESEDFNKLFFMNDTIDDLESGKEGCNTDRNLNDNSKLKTLLRKTDRSIIENSRTNTKIKSVKKKQQVSCGVCGIFLWPYKMKKHMVSHSDERPFACDLCPKTYKYQLHLNTHRKTHDSVLPLYCEVCGQGFVDASRLKRHAMLHTDQRPFSCSECGAGFITRYKLDRHMTKHTGQKIMQCDLCGMRFATKDGLKSHVSFIHHGERRFQCAECDQQFFTNYQLKCHTMKHSGERPFKCSLCTSGFIERKELRRHMKKLHNANIEGESLGQNVKQIETVDTGKKSAVAKMSDQSRVVKVESVSQSTPAATSPDCAPTSDSRTLPVFVATLDQSETCDNHQGTGLSSSEQLQPCGQSIAVVGHEPFQASQSNCESDSIKYAVCLPAGIKNIQFENQAGQARQYCENQSGNSKQFVDNQARDCRQYFDNQSVDPRQFDVGAEQRDVIYFNSVGERMCIPLYVKDQVNNQNRDVHSQEHFTLL